MSCGALPPPPNVIVRDVACYTAGGTLANQQAMITYASKS
jgi:hypothetical protein